MGQKIWPLWKPQHAAAASCSLAESLVLSLSVKTFYFWAAGESNPRLLPAAWTVALLLLQLAACCRHGRSVSPASASVQSLQASASAAVRLCDRESCVCWHRVCVCVCVVMSLRLMLLADAQTWTASATRSRSLSLSEATRSLLGHWSELMQYSHYLAYFVGSNCLHYFALFNIIWF